MLLLLWNSSTWPVASLWLNFGKWRKFSGVRPVWSAQVTGDVLRGHSLPLAPPSCLSLLRSIAPFPHIPTTTGSTSSQAQSSGASRMRTETQNSVSQNTFFLLSKLFLIIIHVPIWAKTLQNAPLGLASLWSLSPKAEAVTSGTTKELFLLCCIYVSETPTDALHPLLEPFLLFRTVGVCESCHPGQTLLSGSE